MNIDPSVVHLWHIDLSRSTGIEGVFKVMSETEITRAESIQDATTRHNYCQTRLAIRKILAGYLGMDAKNLTLTTNEYDKPMLLQEQHPIDLRFNLSHTTNMAVLAVTVGNEIGVDIERNDRQIKVIPLARRYFADTTLEKLTALPDEAQRLAFLGLWTRFEAYKKARGDGLRGDNQKLALPLANAGEDAFEAFTLEPTTNHWQVARLNLGESYTGSLVIDKKRVSPKIEHHRFIF